MKHYVTVRLPFTAETREEAERLAKGAFSASGFADFEVLPEGQSPEALATVMGEFAPNSNVFPDKHQGNLCDSLWSLCRTHGEHRMAEELTTVSNKMRAAQWDVLGKEKG